ncbi:hypothetical protein [Aidingimonas lacisalsi]|uniref:hypothetical protein n=1 Tax=Aidingimonas lacisalsi TaxID=2604086 RepID=UPI0011D18AA6|nr:hypothetical protein [Aidingimonas lacisalsi]
MTIDDYVKLTQIGFYLAIASVTVLTYLKAKDTLLNSVNTEYHKHVIDALIKASDSLFSEFDENSENHWTKGDRIKDTIEEINNEFIEHKEKILEMGEFPGGVRVSDLERRLMSMIREYKSDPFLPEEIRSKIVDLLQNRFDVHHSVTFREITEYRDLLAQGKHNDSLEMNYAWVSNKINDQLYKQGCGVSQVEEAVHEIRMDIKSYLEKFNPLKNA